MRAKILDGKSLSSKIKSDLKTRIERLKNETGIIPCIANIVTVNDEAVLSYMKNKDRVCMEMGVDTKNYILSEDACSKTVLDLIDKLNNDKEISGIVLQLPLANHLEKGVIVSAISPIKDLDGLNPINMGLLIAGEKCLLPCTAKGIIRLIKSTGIEICGKNAVVIGRSNIVGKPTASLLLNENATVTLCHSRTNSLKDYILKADIVVSAVGKPGVITADMIKEGAIVIDAGTKMISNRLTGDVDFDRVCEVASWITPVPGGVGSMTTAMLIENTLEALECMLKLYL